MLDMMVGSATDRRLVRKAVMMVAEGIAMWQRSAARGECSTRRQTGHGSEFRAEGLEAVLETPSDGVNQQPTRRGTVAE